MTSARLPTRAIACALVALSFATAALATSGSETKASAAVEQRHAETRLRQVEHLVEEASKQALDLVERCRWSQGRFRAE